MMYVPLLPRLWCLYGRWERVWVGDAYQQGVGESRDASAEAKWSCGFDRGDGDGGDAVAGWLGSSGAGEGG